MDGFDGVMNTGEDNYEMFKNHGLSRSALGDLSDEPSTIMGKFRC